MFTTQELRKRGAVRTARGFTLVELLLVMVIIVILAGIVVPRLTGSKEKANISAAKAQISDFKTALHMYEVENNNFPTTEQNLAALITNPGNVTTWKGPYLDSKTVPQDPWGHAYVYQCPGSDGQDFDLYSTGADGQQHIEP